MSTPNSVKASGKGVVRDKVSGDLGPRRNYKRTGTPSGSAGTRGSVKIGPSSASGRRPY